MPSQEVVGIFFFFCLGVVLTANLILLALFVLVAGRALMALANARANQAVAAAQEDAARAGSDAVDELAEHRRLSPRRRQPASDDELLAAVIAERQAEAGLDIGAADITTTRNEDTEERPPMGSADSFFRMVDE
jgi:hypothetical protein